MHQLQRFKTAVVNGDARFLFSTGLVVAAKIAVASYMYFRLGGVSGFHTGFQVLMGISNNRNPLYLFISWDSRWYIALGKLGQYSSVQSFGFFPVYPIIIHLLYILTHDELLSAVIPTLVAGIACVPIFQLVAEQYMDRESAVGCTLIASFFPLVFLYTTVAYAEPLLLLLSLLLWLLYMKGKVGWAAVLLAIASVTRTYGLLFGLPMVLDLISKKRFKSMTYLTLPVISILSWSYYNYYSTGDWLAFRSAEITFWNNRLDWLRGWIISFLSGHDVTYAVENNHSLMTLTVFMVAIVALLVLLTFQSDWRLGIMSLALYLVIISFSGPPEGSYVRYFSFIYPIWFIARIRSWKLIAIYCALMMINSAILWSEFLAMRWVS